MDALHGIEGKQRLVTDVAVGFGVAQLISISLGEEVKAIWSGHRFDGKVLFFHAKDDTIPSGAPDGRFAGPFASPRPGTMRTAGT